MRVLGICQRFFIGLVAWFGLSGQALGGTAPTTVAHVHWLGKKRLESETNAAFLMDIWKLPQSVKLEAQTLDKLSTGGWRVPLIKPSVQLVPSSGPYLRPLLDDLLQSESYLEVRLGQNHDGEFAFAVRLEPDRAQLWMTNLAHLLESALSQRVRATSGEQRGWTLQTSNAGIAIEFKRAGNWTLLAFGNQPYALLKRLTDSIGTSATHNPFPSPPTNFWLEANLDVYGIANALGLDWKLPENLPSAELTITGDGKNVRTRGEFVLPQPILKAPEPWIIPTNILHDPIISFTAIQGIKPWLAKQKLWSDLQFPETPNQVYFWAQDGLPYMSYSAALQTDASNSVYRLSERLVRDGNQWLRNHSIGQFKRAAVGNEVDWTDLAMITPLMKATSTAAGSFVWGGLVPILLTNRPVPGLLLNQVLGHEDLVYYDWEFTAPRFQQWLYTSQFFRVLFSKAQLPAQSTAMAWLTTVGPKLANCTTLITRNGSNRFSLVRKSSIGLTAVEMHLLADWLESPRFPEGLHSELPEYTGIKKRSGKAASPRSK